MSKEILLEAIDDQGVMTLTMNRPESLNALNRPLVEAMIAALMRADQNPNVRSILLTGTGRGFCAGADLLHGGWHVEPGWSQGKITAHSMEHGFNPMVRAIRNNRKPVVTAINGIAAAGGVGMALAGDLVVAAESAAFRLVFAPQLGIIPDVGASWLVPQLIGPARANGLALLGDSLDARTAEQWGLIWKAYPDAELFEQAQTLASRLADGAITGIKATSQAHQHALSVSFDEQLDYELKAQEHFCDQAEFAEGVAAFGAKRKPDFRRLDLGADRDKSD